MIRALAKASVLCLLVACGSGVSDTAPPPADTGGTSGGTGGGGGQLDGATVDGYAFGGHRQLVVGQSPLAGAKAEAFTLPVGDTLVATAQTGPQGRFVFSPGTGNPLPRGRTIWIRVTGTDRVVSGLVNTTVDVSSKSLNETTHVAALGVVAGSQETVSDDSIADHEIAARQQLDTALQSDPSLDFSQLTGQDLARQLGLAAAAAVDAGQVTANRPPQLSNLITQPVQLGHLGGKVTISVTATDPDGDSLTVDALIYSQAGAAPQVVRLDAVGDEYTGSFVVAANDTTETQVVEVAIVADDGVTAPVPGAVRTISVLPDGMITLDILTETLFDEPASRAAWDAKRDRMRAIVRRGRAPRVRQVNANQSIRGADVVFNDRPDIRGQTGNDGLLLLQVPLSTADDGVFSITASIAGRVAYKQFLVLPATVSLRAGDTIEADLVLAGQNDWQQVATLEGLGTLDYAFAPFTAFFNVLDDVKLAGDGPQASSFRPITSTSRPDDGDLLLTNMPVGATEVTGTYADPNNASLSLAFGPLTLDLEAGQIAAVSALVPPR